MVPTFNPPTPWQAQKGPRASTGRLYRCMGFSLFIFDILRPVHPCGSRPPMLKELTPLWGVRGAFGNAIHQRRSVNSYTRLRSHDYRP